VKTVLTVAEYALGFIALAVFAFIIFSTPPTSDAEWRRAFLIGGGLAVVETSILLSRQTPCNRLILAANFWLMAGAAAFLLQQWWWLRLYRGWGAAGLLGTMVLVGIVASAVSPAGFVAEAGPHLAVLQASLVLLGIALFAWAHVAFATTSPRGAYLPILGLAVGNHLLRLWVRRQGAAAQKAKS
jgi:hypothetical protein